MMARALLSLSFLSLAAGLSVCGTFEIFNDEESYAMLRSNSGSHTRDAPSASKQMLGPNELTTEGYNALSALSSNEPIGQDAVFQAQTELSTANTNQDVVNTVQKIMRPPGSDANKGKVRGAASAWCCCCCS